MNQLSWLIYWAGVCGNIGPILGILSGLFFGSVVVKLIITGVTVADGYFHEEEKANLFGSLKNFTLLFLPLAVLLAFMAAFVPGKDTLYAIAASQAGEQILHSPTAGLAEQALDSWLKRQIIPPPEPATHQ